MKSVTVFNNKGGVGKTTFLCNLASYLQSYKRKKILIIDADPQCNATIYLLSQTKVQNLYSNNERKTINTFLNRLRKGKGYIEERITPQETDRFKVDLIPGDPNLALSEDLLASDWKTAGSGDPRGLQTSCVFIDLINRYRSYDIILIDVGPSLGGINRAILLASDYFIMPMSSDIFSTMAIKNISVALLKWKKGLESSLRNHKEEENESYKIKGKDVKWHLQFAGYITQQYTAKAVKGIRQPVKAYERILKLAPKLIQKNLVAKLSNQKNLDFKLGEIPNLHSIVPMSQTVNAPIFELKGKDGVVGAHFVKVNDAKKIYKEVAQNFLKNIGEKQ